MHLTQLEAERIVLWTIDLSDAFYRILVVLKQVEARKFDVDHNKQAMMQYPCLQRFVAPPRSMQAHGTEAHTPFPG